MSHGAAEATRFQLVCAAIVILMTALNLPSIGIPRLENDERIYWSLAENWIESRAYSLRGTEILDSLPPAMYDKPLFHHPPLLMFLLIPFAWMDAERAAVVVSWLGHAAAVAGVAMMSWTWRRPGRRAADFLLWLPVLAMAADPVFLFAGRRIWPDTLVGGFGALAVGACAFASGHGRAGWAAAGGVFAAFAGLAKLTGLLALPIGILVLAAGARSLRERLVECGLFLLPCVVLVAPWFFVFYREYACLLPSWIQPDDVLLRSNPHIARAMVRPIGFYFYELPMVVPVVLVATVQMAYGLSRGAIRSFVAPACWGVGGLIAMTFLQAGHGAHLRFLTPAIPGFYAALAAGPALPNSVRRVVGLAATIAMLYGVSSIGFYLVEGIGYDDIVSVPEKLYRAWYTAQ
ncbi:MAG: hypothetical protein KF841_09105 [Phycisphaerae bacterium]|nr:hypothetical protein [Phycisphaerae bacterium]